MSILLDVLEEVGLRFIMAEGASPEEIKALMRDRIGKGENKGLFAPWAPQRAILSHPVSSASTIRDRAEETCQATGMFLSHGGSNSAMESILFQVPTGKSSNDDHGIGTD